MDRACNPAFHQHHAQAQEFRQPPKVNHHFFSSQVSLYNPGSEIREMSHIIANNKNSFNRSTVINNISDDDSKIHAWLSPLDPRVRHQDIRSQRMDCVGAWLLETREFRSWYGGGGDEPNHATLFCDGNPGVGKSYIT